MKGRRYPLGLQTFERIRKENYIYVDKTELVYDLTHTNNANISYSDRIKKVIETAKQQTGKNVVVLIDEYDAPMHDSMKKRKLN